MRRTAAVLLLLTACTAKVHIESSPSTSTTTAVTAPEATSTTGRPLDVLQIAGAWTVSQAGSAAPYPVGTKLTFAGDGSYTANGAPGSWRVHDAELDLVGADHVFRGYSAVVSPRELRLGDGPPGMTLVRA